MQWFNFLPLIRRNLTPCASFKMYPPSRLQPKMTTLCDFSRRRLSRNPLTAKELVEGNLATHEAELARVVNCGWDNGEIPYEGTSGRTWYDTSTGKEMIEPPMRGAKQTVIILLRENVLLPSEEVVKFLGESAVQYAPRARWYTW